MGERLVMERATKIPRPRPSRGDWIHLYWWGKQSQTWINFGPIGWTGDLPSGGYEDARTRKGALGLDGLGSSSLELFKPARR